MDQINDKRIDKESNELPKRTKIKVDFCKSCSDPLCKCKCNPLKGEPCDCCKIDITKTRVPINYFVTALIVTGIALGYLMYNKKTTRTKLSDVFFLSL